MLWHLTHLVFTCWCSAPVCRRGHLAQPTLSSQHSPLRLSQAHPLAQFPAHRLSPWHALLLQLASPGLSLPEMWDSEFPWILWGSPTCTACGWVFPSQILGPQGSCVQPGHSCCPQEPDPDGSRGMISQSLESIPSTLKNNLAPSIASAEQDQAQPL